MATTDKNYSIQHGTWGLFEEIDEESAFGLYKLIARTSPKNHVLLLIHTPGGDVALTSGLVRTVHKKFPLFETRAVGDVASAGVLLMLAGNLRTALEPATFYTHPMYGCGGEIRPESAKSYSDLMRFQNEWMANLFAERTKKSDPDFWLDFFSRDRYFGTKEAKRLGIIHEIL